MINNINYPSLLYGNGFALNVYLPTLVNLGIKKIFINKNQISNVRKTTNLKKYKKYIIYFNEEDYKDQFFYYTILAVSPAKQYSLLLNNRIINNTNTLILEKPLASSPIKATEILRKLENMNIDYLINYSFRYAVWYEKLFSEICNLPKDIELFFIWKFRARHFSHNRITWKRFHSEGGGAIRFYGIHLIAILSDLGYLNIEESNISFNLFDDLSSFSCSFKSTNMLPNCKILVNSKSHKNEFSCYYIKDNKEIRLLDLEAPFPYRDGVLLDDPRIDITKRLLKDKQFNYNNSNVIDLWKAIEDKFTVNANNM